MTKIHPLAEVEPGAKLGDNVEVGPFSVIEAGAEIGDGSKIGTHAYISQWARIGKEVKVLKGAVIGTDPQDLKFEGETTVIEIGDKSVIREFTTLNRGTSASGKTVIGEDCLIMAYAHVAHDCVIGDHVILVNNANLGGHVEVGDWAIVGALVPVQQFVRIGKHCYIGGSCKVRQDVPPFIRAAGDPLAYKGINSIGLNRRGFSEDSIKHLKQAYRLVYRHKLGIATALERINDEVELTSEVKEMIGFIESRGDRGMM